MQRSPTCQNCQRNFELKDCRPVGNRIPLLLPCGHTFCEGCILKAAKNVLEVSCFKCNLKIQLDESGEAGVKTILPNIYLLGLLLYNTRVASDKITGGNVSAFNGYGNVVDKCNSVLFTTHDSQNDDALHEEKQDLCEECNVNTPSCQCTICGYSKYCSECFHKVHKSSKSLKKHKPSPIQQSNPTEKICTEHGRKLEFYDQVKSLTVCAICIISEKCKGHKVILLSEVETKSSPKVDDAIKNAKETLSWWQNSSDILKKSLPDKYIEADTLFTEIQDRFNVFHSRLQKRQLELMLEASEKFVSNSPIQENLRGLSVKIHDLTSLLKNVEKSLLSINVSEDKSVKVLEELDLYNDIPCIIERKTTSPEVEFELNIEENMISSLDRFGKIKKRYKEVFTFQKISNLPVELRGQLKNDHVSNKAKNDTYKACLIKNENTLSLDNSAQLVCVTDVTNPNEFKIQRVSDKQRLQFLMTDLNKFCRYANSSENLLSLVEDGQYVCAQFLSDNNWYRARVINKFSLDDIDTLPSWNNGLTVEVLYIDYGNKERLPLTRLRQIPKKFLEVPEMAVSCSLVNIGPPHDNKEWPKQSKKAFTTLTGDRSLIMTIYKRIGYKLYVDLRKPEDEVRNDDDCPSSVRDGLVFLEVASLLSTENSTTKNNHSVRSYKPHEALVVGEFLDVVVTHIDHPDAVYIQNLNSQVHDEQSRLGQVYKNTQSKKSWRIEYPYKNLVCAAKFTVDNAWYRAQVLEVNKNNTVEVEYVDYGNREKIPFSDLRRIPDMYINMSRQCIKVKLHGLRHPEGKEDYSKESKEFLIKFFIGKPLVAVVKGFDNEIPLVELYDTSTDVDINMNELLLKFVLKCEQLDPIRDTVSQKLRQMISKVSKLTESDEKCDQSKTRHISFSYLPPEVPFSRKFTGTGVHVDDQANIFLHMMNDSISDIMHHLNFDTNKFESCMSKTTEGLHPKQAVVGKSSKDGLFYRAEVVKVVDITKVEVKFIDFGNVEVIDISSIHIEPVFLDIPCQCISVYLSYVYPVGGKWSSGTISLLKEYIVNEIIEVEIQSNNNDLLSAQIKLDDGSNLSHTLIEENLAVYVEKVEENKMEPDESKYNSMGVHNSEYLKFTEQVLPRRGLKFSVMVTQVNQPDIVYIQRLPINNNGTFCGGTYDETATDAYNNLKLLESLSEIINRKDCFKGEKLQIKPVIGMACVCMYTSDRLYYRAQIEYLNEDKGLAGVVYVDYGTSEVVTIDRLLPLPSNLIYLPMQSRKVCIAGIKPIEYEKSVDMLANTKWSIESMKMFFSIVADKRLVAEIVDIDSHDVPVIHLYTSVDNSGDNVLKYVGHIMKETELSDFEI